jgi:hypothetical protein
MAAVVVGGFVATIAQARQPSPRTYQRNRRALAKAVEKLSDLDAAARTDSRKKKHKAGDDGHGGKLKILRSEQKYVCLSPGPVAGLEQSPCWTAQAVNRIGPRAGLFFEAKPSRCNFRLFVETPLAHCRRMLRPFPWTGIVGIFPRCFGLVW